MHTYNGNNQQSCTWLSAKAISISYSFTFQYYIDPNKLTCIYVFEKRQRQAIVLYVQCTNNFHFDGVFFQYQLFE